MQPADLQLVQVSRTQKCQSQQDPGHPWTDQFKRSWAFLRGSCSFILMIPVIWPWSSLLLVMPFSIHDCFEASAQLFADEVLILHEQIQYNLWLSCKNSWAPTASISFLWSSESSKAEPAWPQGRIFPQPQKHWKLKHKGYQRSEWKCTRLYRVH